MTLPRRGYRSGFAVYRMRVGDVFWQRGAPGVRGSFYLVTSTSRFFIGARKMLI